MKQLSFLSFFAVAALFCACNNSVRNSDEASVLTDSTVVNEPLVNEEISQMVDIVNSVADCLDSIQIQEEMLFKADENTPKDQIISRMKAFQNLLSRKQAQINKLTNENKSNKLGLANLQKLVVFLNSQIEEKGAQIAKLQDAVQNKDMKISELRYDMHELQQRSNYLEDQNVEQDKQLNEVYYIIADKKELKELGLTRGGGLLSKKKADYANFDKEKFIKKDMRALEKLVIESKNPQLLTEKPTNSYTLTPNEDGTTLLEIKDAKAFWAVSPYLIIQK